MIFAEKSVENKKIYVIIKLEKLKNSKGELI